MRVLIQGFFLQIASAPYLKSNLEKIQAQSFFYFITCFSMTLFKSLSNRSYSIKKYTSEKLISIVTNAINPVVYY